MDFGLDGKIALVCGSSAGIGLACAEALASVGVHVFLNARNPEKLEAVASRLAVSSGMQISHVCGDVTTVNGREVVLRACPSPDILINNAAGPPPGHFRDFDVAAWQEALRVSMISPIEMIRGVVDHMQKQRWGRIINITSSAVKAPLPMLGLSNGARSGLTGYIAGLARELAADGITINNLLPGRIQTDRLNAYVAKLAAASGSSTADEAARLAAANPMKRFGVPEEIGAFSAFLASRQAAYITGQNILVDGGEYPGL